MKFLKEGPRRWVTPVALAATLVAGLLITPVVAQQVKKGLTAQKVNKTINKKTNARQAVGPAAATILGPAATAVVSIPLSTGNWTVGSTFDVRRDAENVTVSCQLAIPGVASDSYSSFHSGFVGSMVDGAAMQTAARIGPATSAQLLCSATGGASVKNAEITATKVPKLAFIN